MKKLVACHRHGTAGLQTRVSDFFSVSAGDTDDCQWRRTPGLATVPGLLWSQLVALYASSKPHESNRSVRQFSVTSRIVFCVAPSGSSA